MDYIFTFSFGIEALFKIIALGFVLEKGTYLRQPENIMDLFIVITSIADNVLMSEYKGNG